MEFPVFFDHISLDLPLDRIYSRLGYSREKTSLSEPQKAQTKTVCEEAASLISLQGAGLLCRCEVQEESRVVLANGQILASKNLATMLGDCRQVLLLGATAGKPVVDAVSRLSDQGFLDQAVIYDAVASEMVDLSLDWMINYFDRQLSRENRRVMKRRFSAGFGDFALSDQKILYTLLCLNRYEVAITDHYILVPEKSVTAVTGIEKITANG